MDSIQLLLVAERYEGTGLLSLDPTLPSSVGFNLGMPELELGCESPPGNASKADLTSASLSSVSPGLHNFNSFFEKDKDTAGLQVFSSAPKQMGQFHCNVVRSLFLSNLQ